MTEQEIAEVVKLSFPEAYTLSATKDGLRILLSIAIQQAMIQERLRMSLLVNNLFTGKQVIAYMKDGDEEG